MGLGAGAFICPGQVSGQMTTKEVALILCVTNICQDESHTPMQNLRYRVTWVLCDDYKQAAACLSVALQACELTST